MSTGIFGSENMSWEKVRKWIFFENWRSDSRMVSKFETWLGSSSVNKHFWEKVKKVDPPKIGHFRGGLLSSLLAKNPSKWLYYENFFTLVTSKMHFEPLRGFFGQKWRKQTPPKMANFGGSTFFTFSQKCLFTELEPIWV